MKKLPYQSIAVNKQEYWDYNFKLKGIVYEVSVHKKTGEMYVNQDENQGNKKAKG